MWLEYSPHERTECKQGLITPFSVILISARSIKTSPQNITLLRRKCFTIIPSRSRRSMWASILKINWYERFQSKNIEWKICICTVTLLKPQIWWFHAVVVQNTAKNGCRMSFNQWYSCFVALSLTLKSLISKRWRAADHVQAAFEITMSFLRYRLASSWQILSRIKWGHNIEKTKENNSSHRRFFVLSWKRRIFLLWINWS